MAQQVVLPRTLKSDSAKKETNATADPVAQTSHAVEAQVRAYFADIPIMIEIARCESRFRHGSHGEVLRGVINSSDVGVMQVNEYYHTKAAQTLGLNLHDINDNMAYARHLYEREGTRPWNSSKPCWGKSVEVAQN